MAQKLVRFSVDVTPEVDARFQEIADLEDRTKRNMTQVALQRLLRLWKAKPDLCRELGLIVPNR